MLDSYRWNESREVTTTLYIHLYEWNWLLFVWSVVGSEVPVATRVSSVGVFFAKYF